MKQNLSISLAAMAVITVLGSTPLQEPATHVPVRWTVETSRVQPAQFEAYQGETLDLEATMQSYGRPFEFTSADAKLYWQTNGMGGAWWSAPAELKLGPSGLPDGYKATWLPDYDAGASVYNCFIGQPNGNYRAEFRLRLRPSPGATPNPLEIPRPSIDFSTVEVLNPPWVKSSADRISDGVNRIDADGQVYEKVEFGEWTFSDGLPHEMDFGDGGWTMDGYTIFSMDRDARTLSNSLIVPEFMPEVIVATLAQTSRWERVGALARESQIPDSGSFASRRDLSAVSNSVSALGATVNSWQTYWDGDDVRLTVTNYYGSMDIPSLYLEQKMPAGDGHDAPWFRVVWDERTRWNTFLPGYTAVTNDIAQNKADRAWGVYDSSSGAYSPDDMLQISQSRVMIAPGMAWQKTVVVGGGAVWVLRSTLPVEMSGTDENGFFRIEDGDGHALFEIVKGDKQIKPATSVSATKTTGGFSVGYRADSPVHPVGEVCFDLTDGTWIPEDDLDTYRVTWSGERPNWTATVEPVGPRAMPDNLFFKASYEAGGNTYIRHNVATSMDKVVIGGREYMVTVENVGGKNLMVLK